MTVYELLFSNEGGASLFSVMLTVFLIVCSLVLCILPRGSQADSIGLDIITGIVLISTAASIVWINFAEYFSG